jgi:hypothetical protein
MRGFCHADAVEDFRKGRDNWQKWKEGETGVLTKRESTRRN